MSANGLPRVFVVAANCFCGLLDSKLTHCRKKTGKNNVINAVINNVI